MSDSMKYIRDFYKVPAKIGGRVEYTGNKHKGKQFGTIKGAEGAHLSILLDGEKTPGRYHPEWEIKYISEEDK